MSLSVGISIYPTLIRDTSDIKDAASRLLNRLEEYDPQLRIHSDNVARYALQIASFLNLSGKDREALYLSGLFHDIGKTLIPQEILLKPDVLTPTEYIEVKKHPLLGVQLLEPIINVGEIKAGILHHHERYDGHGYPYGLAGEDIPLSARILTVADVFDALTSNRPYRNALSIESAVGYIISSSGTLFDPTLVSIFKAIMGFPGHI